MGVLHDTRPHFVRCIIPNHEKKPGTVHEYIQAFPPHYDGIMQIVLLWRL